MKQKAMKKLLYYGAVGILALIFIGSSIIVIKTLWEQKKDADVFDELQELVLPPEGADTQNVPQANEQGEEVQSRPNIAALMGKNEDCIGWLSVGGSKISYPIMHTPDEPEKYLRRNFYGQDSRSGVPFLEAACNKDIGNLLIYGHNMKNGTMFSDLTKYTDPDYATTHPTIALQGEGGHTEFSVYAVVDTTPQDEWYSFLLLPDQTTYDRAVEQMVQKAIYTTQVSPQYGKRFITLSTCYGKDQQRRLLVIGVEK